MALLEEYIENVRGMVREANNPIYDSGVDQYEDYIRRALRRYSIDRPLVKSASITGTSSEYFIVNTSNLPDNIEYDLDTSIIIQSNQNKTIFYNNVDNPININEYLLGEPCSSTKGESAASPFSL